MTVSLEHKVYGIDLDGVCFDFKNPFRIWLNDHLHCHLEENEITSYYWHESSDEIDEHDFWKEFHNFGAANGYRDLPVLPGTLEALNKLVTEGHEIYYVTNRPEYALEDTKIALEKHNFPFRERLIFAKGKKSPIIKEKNIDVFIDDSPFTLEDITVNTRANIYCRDDLYNRKLDDTFFTRVHNWNEFLEAEGLNV